MKRRKAPRTTMESVASSIGSAVGIAVRTGSAIADDLALAAKKVSATIPKKKARKKIMTRAKKLVGKGTRSIRTTARTLVRSSKAAKRAVSRRRKR